MNSEGWLYKWPVERKRVIVSLDGIGKRKKKKEGQDRNGMECMCCTLTKMTSTGSTRSKH